MTLKILWISCGVLFLIFLAVVAVHFNIVGADSIKKISGSKISVPHLDKNKLTKPPKETTDRDPNINAKSAILIDVGSFKRLYAQNSDLKVPIASTTKIMTSLVVLENYHDRLGDVVTITPAMVNIEGSDIKLLPGEKITVENLLKGLLIMSGNDTACALALHFGGKEQFISRMNEKAIFLGLADTHFRDPAGLDDGGYSTANDLAVLGAYAMRNEKFAEIVKIPQLTISSVDGRIPHELKNSNRMMRVEEQLYYALAIGIKTGFTNEAGHCLISAAQKDGHQILSVILNTNANTLTASAKESKKLLEWGFANWTW